MADTKHTKSTSEEESQTSGFKFPFGNFEEMFKKMQNCCGSDKGSFDCCAMMRQMCGGTSKDTEKQVNADEQ